MTALIWNGWTIEAIAAVNAILAWVAAMVHAWAASKTSGYLRKMFVVIASLALFYSLAYWWLFFFPDRGEEWSNFLRPFGIVTWVVAWSVEPLILIKYLSNRANELEHKAGELADRAKAALDE